MPSSLMNRREFLVGTAALGACAGHSTHRSAAMVGQTTSDPSATPQLSASSVTSTASSTSNAAIDPATTTDEASTTLAPRSITAVLVHGAWHDESTWKNVTPLLTDRGVSFRTITLPSTNPYPPLPGLAQDVAAVAAALDSIDGDVVLVGHSYGGMVINEAAKDLRVKHLVFLAAFCPDVGERVIDLAVGEVAPLTATAAQFDSNGLMRIDRAVAVETFYADVESFEAERLADGLQASAAEIFMTPASTGSFRTTPTTYVVCTHDRAISVDRQEQMAMRATSDIHRWDTSHSPFYSRPDLVADLIAACVQKVVTS
jgi:pimeloyl-ACP methyl ester carboxylesterase